MKAKAYRVASQVSVASLEQEVEVLIQAGWQPIGGITFCPSTDYAQYGDVYLQAMILPE